jgi:hypothetical protein
LRAMKLLHAVHNALKYLMALHVPCRMAYDLRAVDKSLSTFNFNIARTEADMLSDHDGWDFENFQEVHKMLRHAC